MDALSNLRRNKGATKSKKRIGRGNASGFGTTAGRGSNGQKSRTGGNIPAGFAGGQTPLHRKMPKYKGFKNINRVEFQVLNVSDLNRFEEGSEINAQSLLEKRLVHSITKPIKILGNGELEKKLTITVDKVSESAKVKIEKAKGTVTVLMQPKQVKNDTAEK
jgi:large subunit ribosomal protein L15